MKKLLAKIAIIGTLAAGFTGIGAVANAAPAQAGTSSGCYVSYNPYGWPQSPANKYRTTCFNDYDWFEEFFFGYRDGYYVTEYHSQPCNSMWRYQTPSCYW
jgi:hypothetical protein